MDFAEELLNNDVENNSAWSFRYFLVRRGQGQEGGSYKELVENECKYVLEKRLPGGWKNEAAWTYLRGFLATTKAEADNSQSTNAVRCFIGDFEWMYKLLSTWYD